MPVRREIARERVSREAYLVGISAYVSWRIPGAKTPRFIPDHTLLAIRHRLFFRTRDEHEEHSSESAIVAEALMNNVG